MPSQFTEAEAHLSLHLTCSGHSAPEVCLRSHQRTNNRPNQARKKKKEMKLNYQDVEGDGAA